MEKKFPILKEFLGKGGTSNKIKEYFDEIKSNIDLYSFSETTDQEIKEFLIDKFKTEECEEYKEWFKLLIQLKLETSIDKLDNENEKSAKIHIEADIRRIFESIGEPENITVEDETINIVYSFREDSVIKKRISDYTSLTKDNIVETISKKYEIVEDKITFIDSVSSYVDFISEFDDMNYVSRGQKDCTYDLKPSLHRLFDNSFRKYSTDFEDEFRQKILFYDASADDKDEEELRAYGQHFGLPTNYLDFTEAHLISLLFAVEEYDYTDNHSIVFFVDALSYNRETINNEIKLVDFSNKESKQSVERNYSDRSYFIKVGNSNERIHFQKGCFLKVDATYNIANMLKNYTKIVIVDRNYKKKILQELFNLGITFENIYPDKDNLVRTIKFIKTNMEA